jgi:hypothetical protein
LAPTLAQLLWVALQLVVVLLSALVRLSAAVAVAVVR